MMIAVLERLVYGLSNLQIPVWYKQVDLLITAEMIYHNYKIKEHD